MDLSLVGRILKSGFIRYLTLRCFGGSVGFYGNAFYGVRVEGGVFEGSME